jgi:hypothetical protein
MRSPLWIAASAFLLAQCALRQPGPEAFSFGVFGDAPYNEREEPAFMQTIERMNAEPLAFVVHVGDFKAGSDAPCTDALFAKRRAAFDTSSHPFVLTPGDNDWVDCRRPSNGAADPVERLEALRRLFFAGAESLGTRRMATRAHPRYPENRMWEHGSVVFATINVQGSNNNRGFDAAGDGEADARDQANLAWLAEAERRAASARALVVLTQADLWVTRKPTYRPYIEALVDIAARLRKPVLFVHGDTHQFRSDAPFRTRDGTTVANPSRLEVYGSPFVGWVRVDVDTTRPGIFTVEPKLTALVP